MITLINYELGKLLKWKGIYIALCILLFLYGLYIYSISPSSLASYRSAYEYYRTGEGYITDDKIALAREGMKEINKLHDEGIKFDEKALGKSILYRDILEAVDQRNIYNNTVNYYKSMEKRDKDEELSYELLKKVGPPEAAYYTEGWKRIIEFTWKIGRYFILAIVLLGASVILPQEHSTGMYSLINSTKESRQKLIYAKVGTVIVYTALAAVVLAALNIITNGYLYGLKGWNVPLRNIYFMTPFRIRVWQFFVLQQLFYIVSISVFAIITLLISVLSKNSIISLSSGGIVFAAFDYIPKLITDNPVPGSLGFFLRDFTKLKDIYTSYLNVYNILGYQILYEVLFAVILCLLLTLMGLAVWSLYRKYCKADR